MKKKKTVYEEEIFFPCEFRCKPMTCVFGIEYDGKTEIFGMPCTLVGWVQDEVHIQCHYQSLN